MEFVETNVFTARIHVLLDDDDYGELQYWLAHNPKAGRVIPGTQGIRKIRWRESRRGRGKRGGIRVIYYCWSEEKLYLLLAYGKWEQENLTREQLYALREYIKGGAL